MLRPGKHALLAALLVAALAPACAGSPESSEPSSVERAERKKRGRATDPEPVSEEGKKWGGWRWKGKRADCFYVHDNQCFADKAAACKAAGCGEARCREKDDSSPIKVRCK